jgi:hypothetical protein
MEIKRFRLFKTEQNLAGYHGSPRGAGLPGNIVSAEMELTRCITVITGNLQILIDCIYNGIPVMEILSRGIPSPCRIFLVFSVGANR